MEPRKIRCSWDEYAGLCERLVARVAMSGWRFDSILCLARGGMRAGDFFSRIYDMPLALLAASSYRAAAGTEQGELDIADCITGLGELKGRVLLVDDLLDTGKTMAGVRELLPRRFPGISEVRVAVIWVKARSAVAPDYCVIRLDDDPWIVQPFEVYDAMGVEALLERCRGRFGESI